MANISKDLSKLFKDYILRSAEERKRGIVNHANNFYSPLGCRSHFNGGMTMSQCHDSDNEFRGVIYFYEWSDVSRMPQTFFTVDAFKRFLSVSGIELKGYEAEIIKALHVPFITCKKGCKDLIIKDTLKDLREELNKCSSGNTTNGVVPTVINCGYYNHSEQYYG